MSGKVESKVCSKCEVEKGLGKFYFRKDTQKYRNECKVCGGSNDKTYREANKEELRALQKTYRQSHKEEYKAINKAYYEIHKEELKAYGRAYHKSYYKSHKEELRAYRQSHKEETKPYKKAYYQSHKEEYRIYGRASVRAGSANLSDGYLKGIICANGIPRNLITPEMIELKRAIIYAERAVKEHTTGVTG